MTNKIEFDSFAIDQFVEIEKEVTPQDVQLFADVTGDNNPVHLDDAFAKQTQFGRTIAHGMLSAGFISAAIGTRLPGPGCIYLEQSLKFKAPVFVGEKILTRITITDINTRRRRLTLKTECFSLDKLVVTGEANVMVP